MFRFIIDDFINKIAGIKYIFKSKKSKLQIIQNEDFSIKETIKIIKTFSATERRELIKEIFMNMEEKETSSAEIVRVYKMLSYTDRVRAINDLSDCEYMEDLARSFSRRDIRCIVQNECIDQEVAHVIVRQLKKFERVLFYNFSPFLYSDCKIEILKTFSENYIKRFLSGKSHFLKELNSKKLNIIGSLSQDSDKLICFKTPNKYNITLNEYEKISLIKYLSDDAKKKFIDGTSGYNIALSNRNKKEIIESFSDKNRTYYLSKPEILKTIYEPYNYDEFFNTFGMESARIILENRDTYFYKLTGEDIVSLITKLTKEERKDLLRLNNKYNIELDNDQKVKIISSLSDNEKMLIITKPKTYDLKLEQKNIIAVIKSMKGLNIIYLLMQYKDIGIELSKKEIWNIIEGLSEKDAISILSSKDPFYQEFVETYKTSLVKCLSAKEKLAIIYGKSSYNIHLSDTKKIKILKSLDDYTNIEKYLPYNIFSCFDDMDIINRLIHNENEIAKLPLIIQEHLVSFIVKININNEDMMLFIDILKYVPNGIDILLKYESIKEFFKKLNININDFFQYGINSNKYTWYTDILNLFKNNKEEEFFKVKEYFFSNYYQELDDPKYVITNFLELLKSFNNYEMFCLNVINNCSVLSKEEKEDIRFLFNSPTIYKVNNLKEITSIREEKIASYALIGKYNSSLCDLKAALVNLLFNKSLDEIKKDLDYTGGTVELKTMLLNAKDNIILAKMVNSLVLMTSLLERIISCTSFPNLQKTLLDYCDAKNIEHTKKVCNYCSKYEKFIRELYEYDLDSSLTRIGNIGSELRVTYKARELAEKYGGEVIDLSGSQYVLAAHVKSNRESLKDLILGNSDGKSNFICMSPTSHRGQHYYSYSKCDVVFAYDNIPKNSFICSSISNMGTNGVLKYNSLEVPTMNRTQRNVLETSEALNGNNAEILLYRKGIRPCGIIVPSGVLPSDEAIKIHKEYNLPFIITQEIDKTIENPSKIVKQENKEFDFKYIDDKEVLEELKKGLINLENTSSKTIAVIADPHALYEPTLACLVDIKRKGIKEIYSLGDNIGHGPNPKEVLSLLKEYGVKSVYGNHELYLIEEKGPLEFKEHFPSQESMERTIKMNEWIKLQLSNENIATIKNYPDRYEITLQNGKKIVLIHSNSAYNSEGKYSINPRIDKGSVIIKGHEHFANQVGDTTTLRAVGIGQGKEDDGMATYGIIDTTNGICKINTVNVTYNRRNLLHTINESNMPIEAKGLISSWVKTK